MDGECVIYGLKNCDSCRKALKALQAAGRDVSLSDVRENPVPAAALAQWVQTLGGAIVNRRSPSWRQLSPADQALFESAAGIVSLLGAHPTVMKRPVIVCEGHILLGWTAETQAGLGLSEKM